MRKKRRSDNKMYSKTYYNYGSEAYKYYPEFEYGRRRRRKSGTYRSENLPKRRSEKRIKKTAKHRVHYEFVNVKKGDFKVYFSIATFFTFVIAFICMFAVNNQKQAEINSNVAELKRIEETNSVLQTESIKNINLEKVEKIAMTKLNMQKPAPHQIVYINIPKQSYTVQYNSVQKEEEGFSFSKIWNNLFGE